MEKSSFRNAAILAAKAAGQIHQNYFGRKIKIKTKDTEINRVTCVDVLAQKKIVSILKKHFPTHGFLGEENLDSLRGAEYVWIIDPLDGTSNFSHKIPIFSVSIALAFKEKIILGVVFDPCKNELFVAEKGKGATLNGRKIKVTNNFDWENLIASTGFGYERGQLMKKNIKNIEVLLSKSVLDLRRMGSAALELCYVACGRFDAYWEYELNPWDFSAGKLIVEEAGGQVSDFKNREVNLTLGSVIATNGVVHKRFLDLFC